MPPRVIGNERTAYLRFELEHGDPVRQKNALQDLSWRYRHGEALTAENRNSFEKTICGMVLTDNQDAKVARWCLNNLALIGHRENSGAYVRTALKKYEDQAEIVAAGVAALCRMHRGDEEEFEGLKVSPKLKLLAALQYTEPKKLPLSGFRIEIDSEDEEILKLALITVGLNREIEHLFHPRASNGEIVKKLGGHPDKIVMQYSAWAVLENERLTIDDLGVPLDDIDKLPRNVQSKVLQAVAEMDTDQFRRHKFIADGPFYSAVEAREGLAKGLRSVYYDGLADVTLEWFHQETHFPTQCLLAEHFARNAASCPPYEAKALELIETTPELTQQLLVGAEKTPLYAKLRVQQGRAGMDDLFARAEFARVRFEGAVLLGAKGSKAMTRKVLLLMASPLDQGRLRIDQECRDLEEKLKLVQQPVHELRVKASLAVRTDQIQEAILNEKPEILHFSGHGGSGKLVFENKTGGTAEVTGKAIAELIGLNDCIKCVILGACYSDRIASLVRPHVECVVGCAGSIADDAAIVFTAAFYRAIALGRSYAEAFQFAQNDVRIGGMEKEARKFKIK